MQKRKEYQHAKFTPEVIRKAVSVFERLVNPDGTAELSSQDMVVEVDDSQWSHDTEEELFSDYRRSFGNATYRRNLLDSSTKPYVHSSIKVDFSCYKASTTICVEAERRDIIEAVFEVFEQNIDASFLQGPIEPLPKPTVFIGHGHSQVWRDLKDHLHEQHGFPVEAYETGARAGHAIRDILEDMADRSSFALLVMTADDKVEGDVWRARQNVIHETGLFQGRLGFSRAIVLLEEGVEEFSNINGIQQIRFSKGNIRETFGDVLGTLRREFGDD